MFKSSFLNKFLGRSVQDLIDEGSAQVVAENLRCGEGPAWLAERGLWIFSDIPSNRMMSFDTVSGLQDFRGPSNNANGNFALPDGGWLTCEHLTRRVIHTAADGTISVVCDHFDGKRLNSPNDVIADTNGTVWFTDPTYGILSDEEGKRANPEQSENRVYRVDPRSGIVQAVVSGLSMPNGLCLSPDETQLFVGDSGAEQGPERGLDPDGPRSIYCYPIGGDGSVQPGFEFCRVSEGVPDGIRCDSERNIWAATGGGIECFSPGGVSLGIIALPYVATNLCVGGPDADQLFVTTTDRAYLINGP